MTPIKTDETQRRIAGMIKDMPFNKRMRTCGKEKERLAGLEYQAAQTAKELNRLRLGLWHAVEKADYRSLTADAAARALKKIARDIDAFLEENDE